MVKTEQFGTQQARKQENVQNLEDKLRPIEIDEESLPSGMERRSLRRGNYLIDLGLVQGKPLEPEHELAKAHERIILSESQPGIQPDLPPELAAKIDEWEPDIPTVGGEEKIEKHDGSVELVTFQNGARQLTEFIDVYQQKHNTHETFFDANELSQIISQIEQLKQSGKNILDDSGFGGDLDNFKSSVEASLKKINLLRAFIDVELNKEFGDFATLTSNLLLELEPEIAKLPNTQEIQNFIKKDAAFVRDLIAAMLERAAILKTPALSITGVSKMNFFSGNANSWGKIQPKMEAALDNLKVKYDNLSPSELLQHKDENLKYQRWRKDFETLDKLNESILKVWRTQEALYQAGHSLNQQLLLHPKFGNKITKI